MDLTLGDGPYAGFLPLVVFLARIADVSLGTLRINFVARGFKIRASLIGFVEVLIWITIVAQIVRQVHSWANILAFAGGFAAGTYVGMRIEEHLAIGNVWVRVIAPLDPNPLVTALRTDGYGVTLLDARGAGGPTTILLILARRSHLGGVLLRIRAHLPEAFYTVEDVRATRQGIFPGRSAPDSNGPRSE
jgi:uncharacterized protein YebE (UPF0316 family)